MSNIFFRLSIHYALAAKIQADKVVRWCQNLLQMNDKFRPIIVFVNVSIYYIT